MIGGDPALLGAKIALRDQVLTARNRRSLARAVRRRARRSPTTCSPSPEVRRAATVAAYVSIGSEPGTGLLLRALAAAGKRVVLPVLLPDGDLDWARVRRRRRRSPRARLGLLEPVGPRLGVDAVATADVVLVPGLAVSPTGDRLGRGGGSYDRALGRVPGRHLHLRAAPRRRGRPRRPRRAPRPRVTAAATPSGDPTAF